MRHARARYKGICTLAALSACLAAKAPFLDNAKARKRGCDSEQISFLLD